MPPLPGLGFRFGEGVRHLGRWRHQVLSCARLFLFIESARGLAQPKSWRMDLAHGQTRSVLECGSLLPLSASNVGQSRGAHPPRVRFDAPRVER